MPRKNSILFYYPYLALVVCVFLFFCFPYRVTTGIELRWIVLVFTGI